MGMPFPTAYGRCDSITKKVRDSVRKGEKIAETRLLGTMVSHVHFMLAWVDNWIPNFIDPYKPAELTKETQKNETKFVPEKKTLLQVVTDLIQDSI